MMGLNRQSCQGHVSIETKELLWKKNVFSQGSKVKKDDISDEWQAHAQKQTPSHLTAAHLDTNIQSKSANECDDVE